MILLWSQYLCSPYELNFKYNFLSFQYFCQLLLHIIFIADPTHSCRTSQCDCSLATCSSKDRCCFEIRGIKWGRSSRCGQVKRYAFEEDKTCSCSSCLKCARYCSVSQAWFLLLDYGFLSFFLLFMLILWWITSFNRSTQFFIWLNSCELLLTEYFSICLKKKKHGHVHTDGFILIFM